MDGLTSARINRTNVAVEHQGIDVVAGISRKDFMDNAKSHLREGSVNGSALRFWSSYTQSRFCPRFCGAAVCVQHG